MFTPSSSFSIPLTSPHSLWLFVVKMTFINRLSSRRTLTARFKPSKRLLSIPYLEEVHGSSRRVTSISMMFGSQVKSPVSADLSWPAFPIGRCLAKTCSVRYGSKTRRSLVAWCSLQEILLCLSNAMNCGFSRGMLALPQVLAVVYLSPFGPFSASDFVLILSYCISISSVLATRAV